MTQIKAKQIGDFTSAVRNQLVAGTGITISSGTIATTITQYTDALAKSASVVNSMAGTQSDQAPSVSSIKNYYTAGTGISLSNGAISTSITQYTDALARAAFSAGTGLSYNSSTGAFSLNASLSNLNGVSLGTPTSNQVLQYNGTNWVAATFTPTLTAGKSISVSGSTINVKPVTITTSFNSSTDFNADTIMLVKITGNVTLPTPSAQNTGCTYIIKNTTTSNVTITASFLEGANFTLNGAYSSLTVISDGTNWMII